MERCKGFLRVKILWLLQALGHADSHTHANSLPAPQDTRSLHTIVDVIVRVRVSSLTSQRHHLYCSRRSRGHLDDSTCPCHPGLCYESLDYAGQLQQNSQRACRSTTVVGIQHRRRPHLIATNSQRLLGILSQRFSQLRLVRNLEDRRRLRKDRTRQCLNASRG